jgi:hypothetical protein
LTQAIETLDHQNCPAPEPRIGWVTTWNTRCGIASYSKYLVRCLSVGKVTVLANNALNLTEQDGPEVIRCWEADEKDSLQQLVHRIVAAGITDIVIQFNFSFFNLNALSGFLDTMKGYQKRCYLFLLLYSRCPAAPLRPNPYRRLDHHYSTPTGWSFTRFTT